MIRAFISNRYKYAFETFWQGQATRETGFCDRSAVSDSMHNDARFRHSLSAGRNQASRQRAGSKAPQVRLQRLANDYGVERVRYRDLPGEKQGQLQHTCRQA